jgi:hypothetical protein
MLTASRVYFAIAAALVALTSVSPVLADGNVKVTVEDGKLVIVGDEGDNRISIRSSEFHPEENVDLLIIFRPSYDNDTTINGEAHTDINPWRVRGVTGDFLIKMRGGDDVVDLQYLNDAWAVPGSVRIDVGGGNDFVGYIDTEIKGNLHITTEAGNDRTDFDCCYIAGDLQRFSVE